MNEPATTVSEALATRLAVRDFLPTPVPGALIREILAKASRAPSGGNVQPWHLDVLAGEPLAELKAIMQRRLAEAAAGAPPEKLDYDIYPPNLWPPYRDYRFELGEDMYRLLGIPREDKAARLRWFARNYEFFGAPLALFCSIDRRMGPPQWSDLGMVLQSVMLLLREAGLHSCPQECWSVYPQTVGGFLGLPPERMLFCGMAIGHANPAHPVNALRSRRAPLEAFARFHGVD
jgi:nitroreductase